MPKRLLDGEQVQFTLPTKPFAADNSDTFREIFGNYPRWQARCLRIVARTSAGKLFVAKPEPELREWLLEMASSTSVKGQT
jgi:hypothetical protein